MKHETNTEVKKTRPKWHYILMVAGAVLVLDLILFAVFRGRDDSAQNPAEAPGAGESSVQEAGLASWQEGETTESQALALVMDYGLELRKVGSYTGAYLEDGTNELVSGVAMVEVTNTGTTGIQYGEITVEAGGETWEFSVSTLMPGQTAVLLEQNRSPYTSAGDYQAQCRNVAVFEQEPTLAEEQVKIQALDGVLNVTNVSGDAIEGDVVIYYKNYTAGVYYGGITYRVRIQGGMAPDEIQQIMTEHYSASGSQIMFVTVG